MQHNEVLSTQLIFGAADTKSMSKTGIYCALLPKKLARAGLEDKAAHDEAIALCNEITAKVGCFEPHKQRFQTPIWNDVQPLTASYTSYPTRNAMTSNSCDSFVSQFVLEKILAKHRPQAPEEPEAKPEETAADEEAANAPEEKKAEVLKVGLEKGEQAFPLSGWQLRPGKKNQAEFEVNYQADGTLQHYTFEVKYNFIKKGKSWELSYSIKGAGKSTKGTVELKNSAEWKNCRLAISWKDETHEKIAQIRLAKVGDSKAADSEDD